jgi:hypothetical protein
MAIVVFFPGPRPAQEAVQRLKMCCFSSKTVWRKSKSLMFNFLGGRNFLLSTKKAQLFISLLFVLSLELIKEPKRKELN